MSKENHVRHGITLSEAYSRYSTSSKQVSECVRKLAYAAIAFIWIFKGLDTKGNVVVPPLLIWAGLFAVTTLALDLLQYVVSSTTWKRFGDNEQKTKGPDGNVMVRPPDGINQVSDGFYFGKILTIIVTFGFVILFIAKRLAT